MFKLKYIKSNDDDTETYCVNNFKGDLRAFLLEVLLTNCQGTIYFHKQHCPKLFSYANHHLQEVWVDLEEWKDLEVKSIVAKDGVSRLDYYLEF